jgi:ATP-dependent Clp protease ATP-binding subunit ClpC
VFERFTDRARRVVVLAQEEARLLDHSYIGTEHILLGLVHEEEGLAARALELLGISLVAVRREVEQSIGRGDGPPAGHVPFTPRAKKVLELSLREALQLGHNYIGTEHILLGLVREGEGVAATVLQSFGVELERVREVVIDLVQGRDVEPGRGPVRQPPRGIRPAACAFCGTASPQCGALFTAPRGAALICERCVGRAAGLLARETPAEPAGGGEPREPEPGDGDAGTDDAPADPEGAGAGP